MCLVKDLDKNKDDYGNFYCDLCNYTCKYNSYFIKHLKTNKHKIKIEPELDLQIKIYNCKKCNKEYEKYNSLWQHERDCNTIIKKEETIIETKEEIQKLDYTNDIVGKLIQENQELRLFMTEQSKEFMKTITDLAKNNNSTTVNGNVNNNTNKFNINLFLNEKCKDAINFSDFIKNIEVSHEDLENNAQLGFANGISKILMDNLKQLSIYDRPIHCSDVKRETMYIKDDDKWSNEEDTTKLTSAIQDVSRKSVASLLEWQETNPEFEDIDSDFSNKFITMMQQSIAGSKRDALYPKVIRSLAKETMIDKAN
jgi:hypothetical protein